MEVPAEREAQEPSWGTLPIDYTFDHAAVLGVLELTRGVGERGELGGVVGGRGLATVLLIRVDLAAVLEPALIDAVHIGVVVKERGVVGARGGQHRSADPELRLVVHTVSR